MTARRARRTESAEVVYAGETMVIVDSATVAELISGAAHNPRRRIRLCTHLSLDDAVHEMFIVHERCCYVRPHKHIGKTESFHVIEGEVDVVLFDDAGVVSNVIPMGPYSSSRPFFYRIAEPVYHTLVIRSDVVVFHETTSGPFRRDRTEFAPWSPNGEDSNEIATYLSALCATIAASFPHEAGPL